METQQPVARIVVGPASAPALVLLHGITGSAVSQSEAISHWARAGYRVIALDARGHGLSPRWSPEQLARAGEVLVDDVVAALSEIEAERSARLAAGLPAPAVPPVLIGHSMGGATAMVVAARHPELVSGAVLCDPARYGQRSPAELLARGAARRRALESELADLPAALGRALASDSIPHAEAAAGVWASQHMDPALLDTGVVAPEVPWLEAMAQLTVPTLLVTGDRPGAARVGAQGLAAVEALGHANVTTALVPGAGHDVRRSRPEGFYAAVDPWLAQVLPA
ncbi:alpha/beta fold hydrolase [Actinomyces urogenitalis]|uniref:alpha/beta fold hydrolase n=1 Tax=Actinomyces urogenitalis TaxID=103621 RepID=UPI00242D9A9D|nr:alpha/beta hydrolase [Actinomyces urogenitalis]MCI7457366.1 alpha/beta hydrolase [Actinomyces urogenitalis]